MQNAVRILALAALSLSATSAVADEKRQDRINFAIGYYDVFDEQGSIDFRAEYRPDSVVFTKNLKPWAGIEFTSKGSVWAGGGLLYDWQFVDSWYLTPIFGVGFYNHGSDDKDLNHPVEFKSAIEVSYKFKNDWRLGLSLSHMSNLGLGDDNPGTEVISVNWSIPFKI